MPIWPAYVAAAVCEGVCGTVGITPPLARHRLALYSENSAFDISRARAELGFAPRVDLREGVRRCLEWYRGRNLI
jgi:nucleoside-diphosphate-sugar epimerase